MIPRDLPSTVLVRRAVVYVRQSTSTQVRENLESQRRQYDLAELARSYGFRDVGVIDEDLGCSASGAVDRPGCQSAPKIDPLSASNFDPLIRPLEGFDFASSEAA